MAFSSEGHDIATWHCISHGGALIFSSGGVVTAVGTRGPQTKMFQPLTKAQQSAQEGPKRTTAVVQCVRHPTALEEGTRGSTRP